MKTVKKKIDPGYNNLYSTGYNNLVRKYFEYSTKIEFYTKRIQHTKMTKNNKHFLRNIAIFQ